MPLLDDQRLDLQKAALTAHLAARSARGQITGYLDYASQLKTWLDQLSDGRPLTTPTRVTGADRADLTSLTEFLMTVAIDLNVQEQMVRELEQAIQRHREQVLRHSREWDPQLDALDSSLDAVRTRFRQQSLVTITEPFTRTTTGTVGQSAVIDEARGVLSLRPETLVRAASSLRRAVVTIYPAHHPDGGILHAGLDALDPAQHDRLLVDGPGFERWIVADIPPSVALDGITYEGVVASIDLLYDGSVTFTAIELSARSAYPLEVIRVQARTDGSVAWLDALAPGSQPVTGLTDGLYWVHGLPRTTATQVRVWVRQSHAEQRAPASPVTVSYRHELSVVERAVQAVSTTPGPPRALYVVGLYRLHLLDLAYPSLDTGLFWSHDPASTQGYETGSEPIETVSMTATTTTPGQSTVEWWVRDIDRNTLIPILPDGTSRVRERVRFLSDDDLLLTFPIARGTTPQLFVNGVPLDHQAFPLTEVNSTRVRSPLWSPSKPDIVTVEYDPAIGQTVMVYVVQNRQGATPTVRGALTTANAVFPNRAEADRAIAETADPGLLESYGVLARLDEFDRWFVGGALEDDTGNTALTIPTVYSPPDLQGD